MKRIFTTKTAQGEQRASAEALKNWRAETGNKLKGWNDVKAIRSLRYRQEKPLI